MQVYSWNLLFSNQEFERALQFIEGSGADIFCLQEVPETFLERLQKTSWHMAAAPETNRVFKGGQATHYGVILSRHPILKTERIALAYHDLDLPLRSQLFRSFMFSIGLWAKGTGNRYAVYADIDMPKPVRVLNLHLPLMNPGLRSEELELALTHAGSSLPLIVCGDFNIIESPRVSVLNWLLGGTLSDTFMWKRERRDIEKRFSAHALKNPLRDKSTHPLSRSQLDHILVPADMIVEKAVVIGDRFGSDHCPVWVSLA